MVAPLLAGESGVSPTNGLETACVRNVSAAVSRIGLCVRNCCGHVVHGFENRQVASALAEVRHLDEEVSRELALDRRSCIASTPG